MNPVDENKKIPSINSQNYLEDTDEWAAQLVEELKNSRAKINEIF
jgi:hypothetical protein